MNRSIHPGTWIRAAVFVGVVAGASLFETATESVPLAEAGVLDSAPRSCSYAYVMCRWDCANGATVDAESMCAIKCAWDLALCMVKEALR